MYARDLVRHNCVNQLYAVAVHSKDGLRSAVTQLESRLTQLLPQIPTNPTRSRRYSLMERSAFAFARDLPPDMPVLTDALRELVERLAPTAAVSLPDLDAELRASAR